MPENRAENRAKRTEPSRSLTNQQAGFEYVCAEKTDLAKRFAELRGAPAKAATLRTMVHVEYVHLANGEKQPLTYEVWVNPVLTPSGVWVYDWEETFDTLEAAKAFERELLAQVAPQEAAP